MKDNKRVIAFGHWAGIVGAYNGLSGYGKKHNLYDLKRAHECHDLKELKKDLNSISFPDIKIVLTGKGRVGMGACETLEAAGMDRVTGDHMGMLATIMNALALRDVLLGIDVPSRVLSAVDIHSIVDGYSRAKAVRLLDRGEVVIFDRSFARHQ